MKARLLKRIDDELQTLERERTRELPKEIQRARELGDLRENAEYHAAKERQRLVEARIGMLQTRRAEIELMNLDRLPHDRAALGSTALLRAVDGATVTYEIVMPEDADPAKGWVSTASPIGRAIVGRKEGDEIHVKSPSGVREFELIELTTIHSS